jgi:hypothetical protein
MRVYPPLLRCYPARILFRLPLTARAPYAPIKTLAGQIRRRCNRFAYLRQVRDVKRQIAVKSEYLSHVHGFFSPFDCRQAQLLQRSKPEGRVAWMVNPSVARAQRVVWDDDLQAVNPDRALGIENHCAPPKLWLGLRYDPVMSLPGHERAGNESFDDFPFESPEHEWTIDSCRTATPNTGPGLRSAGPPRPSGTSRAAPLFKVARSLQEYGNSAAGRHGS